MAEGSLRRSDDSGGHWPATAGQGRLLAVALGGVLVCLAGSPLALAATHTWNGTTSGTWETATNWAGSSVPSTGADLLQFGDSSTYSITCATAISGINIARFTPTSSNYSISGSGSWTFNDSGLLLSTSNTNTIAIDIVGGSNLTLQASDGANMVVGSTGDTLAMPATGTSNVLTVDAGSGSTIAINSEISGAASLTKSGSGTLYLYGADTYTGDTTLSAGTLVAGAAGELPSTTDMSISSGATLQCTADQTIASLSGSGTVNLSSAKLTLNTASGTTSTYAGTVTGSGTNSLVKDGVGSQTLSGSVSDINTTVNAGTLTLSGSISAVAATVNSGATLNLNSGSIEYLSSLSGGGTVNLNSGATLISPANACEFSGTLNGNGNTLIQNGTGTLTFSGTVDDLTLYADTAVCFSGSQSKTLTLLGGLNGSVILSNSTLTIESTSAGTYGCGVTLTTATGKTGTLVKEGSGDAVLSGTISNVAMVVNSGSVTFKDPWMFTGTHPQSIASLDGTGGSVTINGTTLTINAASGTNASYAGTVNGSSGTLTKSGVGAQAFTSSVSDLAINANGGTLTLAGTVSNVVAAAGSSGTLVFSGSDAKSVTSLTGSGTVTLSDAALTVANSADYTFSGTMNAADGKSGTLTKSGSGTLTLSGTVSGIGASVSEGTLVFDGAGTKTITSLTGSGNVILTGTTLTVDNSTDATFSGNMSTASGTTGTLTKSGSGTFSLTGTCTDTDVVVNAGTLVFNGTQSGGTTTVNTNGLLQGIGTLANLANYGTVAPGNSIGTLTVTGDYIHAAGSTLTIEINDAGQSDVLHVTGAATLHGGTVDVRAVSGTYSVGQRYTFLRADGGVSGTFSSVIDDLAFLDAALIYGSNTVQLELVAGRNFVDAANTFNQRGVASYLDRQKRTATGDFATVIDQLNLQTESQSRSAFDAISGELFGSLATLTLENSERFMESVAQRLRSQSLTRGFNFCSTRSDSFEESVQETCCHTSKPPALSGWTPWFEGFGVGATLSGDGNASGLDYSVGGLTVGLERSLDDDLFLGLVGGYGNTYTALDSRSDRGTIDSGTFGAYLQRDVETHYQTALATFGYSAYDTTRHISFSSIDRSAIASFNGNNFSFYAETGRNFRGRFVHLQPYAALEYIQVQQDRLVESGADSLDLSVNGINSDAFRGLVGSRVMSYLRTRTGRLVSLEGRAAWRHEFLSESRILDASLVGQSATPFAVAGLNVDRDAAILGCGLTTNLTRVLKFSTSYDLLFSENYAVHAASGSLQCCW
jgi:outer membrane autotransporter protein